MKMLEYVVFLMAINSGFAGVRVEMVDTVGGEGKMYVVMVVIVTILVGFLFLLFKLDKRVKRLEEEIKDK